MRDLGLLLCCRNENGAFCGVVRSVQVGDWIYIDSNQWTEEDEPTGASFQIAESELIFAPGFEGVVQDQANITIPFDQNRHIPCMGNIFWDAFALTAVDTCRLLNWLRGQGWSVEEGIDTFYQKWQSGVDITPEDFEESQS